MLVGALLYLTMRARRANFNIPMTLLGVLFGMPMFAYLLLRSKRAHASGRVVWKGRTYTDRSHRDVGRSEQPDRSTRMKVLLRN